MLAGSVAALPYDVYSRQEAAAEIAKNPQSFLRIDKPSAVLPQVDEYDPAVYVKAKELLDADIAAGLFKQDDEERFFLYRMMWEEPVVSAYGFDMPGGDEDVVPPTTIRRSQLGLVVSVDAEDFRKGNVRRHESSHPDKLADRIQHITTLGAQTGPVLMTHRANREASILQTRLRQTSRVCFDFVDQTGIQHTIWAAEASLNPFIQDIYEGLDVLYIADGHHRAQAAIEIDDQGILAILFPADMLTIRAYNRVVHGLNRHSADSLLALLSEKFTVEKTGSPYLAEPTAPGEFGLYLADAWYRLVFNEALRSADDLAALDVSVLQDQVLGPILGIDDPKTTDRLAYVGGSSGLDGLIAHCAALPNDDNQYLAFALYPTEFSAFFAVADSGRLMPPKSTWFSPKPRSGLFIRPI
jgi:uncharacterized protein (DUF1015 family)